MGIREQISKHGRDFAFVVALVVVSVLVGGYIVAHQRLTVPAWVPFVGEQGFALNAEFETAQAVMPGQGQPVTVAGVTVGTVKSVDLKNGRAVVSMLLDPDNDVTVHQNATLLLRPKTGLKDMAVAMDPGRAPAPKLESGSTLPVSQTEPDVNLDEFLASLDADTRTYLQLFVHAAGEGLKGNGSKLAAVFKRFDPTARNMKKITELLQHRHESIKSAIHDFRLFVDALGTKDAQLTRFVDSSAAALRTFSDNSASIQDTLSLLPGALKDTQAGLGKLAAFADVAGPTLDTLKPTSENLADGMAAANPMLKETTPIINDEISPFALTAKPFFDDLVPAVDDLIPFTESATHAFDYFNQFLNAMAYNPGKKQGGFLFFAAWASHNLNSVFSMQDATGATGRGLLLLECKSRKVLDGVAEVNATARLLLSLLRPPTREQVSCPPDDDVAPTARKAVRR